jgi:Trypsin-like peptidase domain/Gram-negative bacterial TonB protein C-terminal
MLVAPGENGAAPPFGAHSMNLFRKTSIVSLLSVVLLLAPRPTSAASGEQAATQLSQAICPIVYPVDQSASDRGYHYIFYGNAFFINRDGYLLTAAHVLSQLRDSQPYILLQLPMAPPQLVKATVVVVDQDHDVAVLRATPNPLAGRYRLSFLRLATDWPEPDREVLVEAMRPSRLRNPHTFDALQEDRPSGAILEYRFTQFDKGRADTEIFLFNHDVLLGDSGAPVVSSESQAVVGLVEGRWLHGSGLASAHATQTQTASVGAVVPIHYAMALLAQKGIAWEAASESSTPVKPEALATKQFSAPTPVSLVAAAYPAGVLSGGDVVLDAVVGNTGRLADIRVRGGENPFLEKVLSAVQSWMFRPASSGDQAIAARIGIVFQFSGFIPARARHGRTFEEHLADLPERGAQPLVTPEPDLPPAKMVEGNVILCEQLDSRGQIDSIEVLQGQEPLASAAVAAARQWRYSPARSGGADAASEVIVVDAFRR